ncbi:hypothetical protein J7K93_12695 [bacterium]|nr:hypothetical protein [bacterium]
MNSSKFIKYIRKSVFPIFFSLLFSEQNSFCQSRSIKHLEFFSGTDTNVSRDTTGHSADNFNQLFFHYSFSSAPSNRLNIIFNVSSGIKLLNKFSSENRAALMCSGSINLHLNNNIVFGLKSSIRAKYYFNSINYNTLEASPVLYITPYAGMLITVKSSLIKFSMPNDINFEYSGINTSASFRYKFSSKISYALEFSTCYRNFNRPAYGYKESDIGTLAEKSYNQHDRTNTAAVSLRFYSWALVDLRATVDLNKSDSFGYSFYRPQISITSARVITDNLTITLKGVIRKKNYTDSISSLFQIRPETEEEENSFVVLDICRDIGESKSIRMRLGSYINESPFRERYYRKTVISVGFSFRF